MWKILPKFVPILIRGGIYTSNPDIRFFLCKYMNMTDDIPEVQAFTKTLAKLHTKGILPSGKYGFEVPIYKGTIPQYTQWADTCEASFHHPLKWFILAEEKSQGIDEEM